MTLLSIIQLPSRNPRGRIELAREVNDMRILVIAACMVTPAMIGVVNSPAFAQQGVGDEATLNSRRMDLDKQLMMAERSSKMSHREATRHRRALAIMVTSAKRDLRKPPHFISAAENATYLTTIANVETALAGRQQRNQ